MSPHTGLLNRKRVIDQFKEYINQHPEEFTVTQLFEKLDDFIAWERDRDFLIKTRVTAILKYLCNIGFIVMVRPHINRHYLTVYKYNTNQK